jgi:hypothetical protein
MDSIFVRSWDSYLAAKEEQAHQLALKEFVDLTLKEQSTTPVTMDLNQVTTNLPELASFITNQVMKSTAKLCSQVLHLQKTKNQGLLQKQAPGRSPIQHPPHTKIGCPQQEQEARKKGPRVADAPPTLLPKTPEHVVMDRNKESRSRQTLRKRKRS